VIEEACGYKSDHTEENKDVVVVSPVEQKPIIRTPSSKKRRIFAEKPDLADIELVKMVETTQELIKGKQKEDDADLVGKKVANFLRNFGPRKQLEISMEFDRIMMANMPED
jgi:hypothetical protein